jgi:hypothetical protein
MQLQYHQVLQVIRFHVLIVELFLLMVVYVDRIHVELKKEEKYIYIYLEFKTYFVYNKYY